MYCVNSNVFFKTLFAYTRFYRIGHKSHYDVLNLRRGATDKEIKDAFIKMSKEYHPDKNKDRMAQEKFVQIVEAYNVLGKPKSRAEYDNTVQYETSHGSGTYVYRTAPNYNVRYTNYTNFYQEYYQEQAREASKKNAHKQNAYYGVQGVKKQPNIIIIAICVGIALFGTILQVLVIRGAYIKHKHVTLQKSMQISEELERVREVAKSVETNEERTQLLLDRIVAAANPAVATASLGRTLAATEKKKKYDESEEDWILEFPNLGKD